MSDPRTAPYGWVRLSDVDTLAEVDPGNPNINDGAFHLVHRHLDIQAQESTLRGETPATR